MIMNACNKVGNSANQNVNFESSETESFETEMEKDELKGKFLEKLREYTDECAAAIVIDCFAGSDEYSAFVVTVSSQYQLPKGEDEIDSYFIPSSLWYVDELSCVNVYQSDYSGSILLSSGTLKNGMCCVGVGHLTAYAPDVNYNTCYYTVENNWPIYLFTTASSIINDEGYIIVQESFWEVDGRRTKQFLYEYQKGELVFIEEQCVE